MCKAQKYFKDMKILFNQIKSAIPINYNCNNNTNFLKRIWYLSSKNTFISNADSNIKLSQNINSSFKEKIKKNKRQFI